MGEVYRREAQNAKRGYIKENFPRVVFGARAIEGRQKKRARYLINYLLLKKNARAILSLLYIFFSDIPRLKKAGPHHDATSSRGLNKSSYFLNPLC